MTFGEQLFSKFPGNLDLLSFDGQRSFSGAGGGGARSFETPAVAEASVVVLHMSLFFALQRTKLRKYFNELVAPPSLVPRQFLEVDHIGWLRRVDVRMERGHGFEEVDFVVDFGEDIREIVLRRWHRREVEVVEVDHI